MHNTRPRGSLDCYIGSDEPPKPSRAKQKLEDLNVSFGGGSRRADRLVGRDLRQHLVHELLESQGAIIQLAARGGLEFARPKVFVRDIEGDQEGETEQIAGRRR